MYRTTLQKKEHSALSAALRTEPFVRSALSVSRAAFIFLITPDLDFCLLKPAAAFDKRGTFAAAGSQSVLRPNPENFVLYRITNSVLYCITNLVLYRITNFVSYHITNFVWYHIAIFGLCHTTNIGLYHITQLPLLIEAVRGQAGSGPSGSEEGRPQLPRICDVMIKW